MITLNGQSQGILSVLVIGAGTDYALLLISRYREELHDYEDRVDAMIRAWRGAAPPIFASACTVIIGLLCLLVSELNSNRGLGPVCALGIASTLFMMLFFLPVALLFPSVLVALLATGIVRRHRSAIAPVGRCPGPGPAGGLHRFRARPPQGAPLRTGAPAVVRPDPLRSLGLLAAYPARRPRGRHRHSRPVGADRRLRRPAPAAVLGDPAVVLFGAVALIPGLRANGLPIAEGFTNRPDAAYRANRSTTPSSTRARARRPSSPRTSSQQATR